MEYFVFRNNTIEIFFGASEFEYSGYGDISFIPTDATSYIWFYQVPFKSDIASLVGEISEYFDKLRLVYQQLPENRQLIVFTLENLFPLKYSSENYELTQEIERFNSNIYSFSKEHQNVKFIDFSEFIRNYSLEEVVDWKYYFISQIGLNPKLAVSFRKWFTQKINEIQLKRKKCLVLDLDNTLWGGILGEDGISGIKIGGDYPGNAFLYFQEALAELTRKGIILTVCSKNNEQDVLDVWNKNPYIVLKNDYITTYRINWKNKADNIQDIATELNIGLDSFVFIDDNPAERELVRQLLPMVAVPDFPDKPYDLPSFFKSLLNDYFRIYTLTDEDKQKAAQYKANANRQKELCKFTNLDEYLGSLNIEVEVQSLNEYNLSRIAQMTQKTNQFNLTTKRYNDSDLLAFAKDGWKIYCIKVKDKFGDSGITGTMFLKPNGKSWIIDTLLLSCRILGKGIEEVFVQSVLQKLRSEGIEFVEAVYIPTMKNAQVANFYEKMGFAIVDNKEAFKTYSLDLKEYGVKIKTFYKIQFK